jgi:predicted nucleic acid-binding protein
VAVVVDASALVTALVGRSAGARALRRRLAAEVCHAPHLIDAEVGNVLRRRVRELGASGQRLPAKAGSLQVND